jgi:hypothetical protein
MSKGVTTMNDKYRAVYDAVAGFWVVSQGDNYRDNARFYGPTAEQDARNYAAELNSRVPKIELPTEPGLYLVNFDGDSSNIEVFDVVYPSGEGLRLFGGELRYDPYEGDTFTRLYTESEVRELRAAAVESVPGEWAADYSDLGAPDLREWCSERAAEIRAEGQA